MYFELTNAELLAIETAAKADIADARRYSTPRNPQFSDFDQAMFVKAQANRQELQQQLHSNPETAESLASLLAKHDEALSSRMQSYAEDRKDEQLRALSIQRYEMQRGTTT